MTLGAVSAIRPAIVSLAFSFALAPVPSAAMLVTHPIDGTVTLAEPGNPLGVGVGSPISGSTTYDNDLVGPVGVSNLFFADHPSHQLSLTLGSRTFLESDHNETIGSQALLRFLNGDLVGLQLIVDFEEDSQQFLFEVDVDLFSVYPISFYDPNGFPVVEMPEVAGNLDFGQPAIPEPGRRPGYAARPDRWPGPRR